MILTLHIKCLTGIWIRFWCSCMTAKLHQPFNDQCSHHIETIQLICRANQLTDFYMMSTLLIKRVMRWVVVICLIRDNIFPLIVVQVVLKPIRLPLRKKCPYSELFWSAFNCASLRMQSECGKMQTKTTPSTNIFYAVHVQGKDKLLMLYSSLIIQGAIW